LAGQVLVSPPSVALMTRYCFNCAPAINGRQSVASSSLTASQYQLAKYAKHVTPSHAAAINSVFADRDHASYASWIVASAASGHLEIDALGRHNYVYYAGRTTGVTYLNGTPTATCDGVKVVWPYSAVSIHAFPVSIGTLSGATCSRCGVAIVV